MAFQGNSRELSVNSPGSGMRESPWNFREFPRIFREIPGNLMESSENFAFQGITGMPGILGNLHEILREIPGKFQGIPGIPWKSPWKSPEHPRMQVPDSAPPGRRPTLAMPWLHLCLLSFALPMLAFFALPMLAFFAPPRRQGKPSVAGGLSDGLHLCLLFFALPMFAFFCSTYACFFCSTSGRFFSGGEFAGM